jgi:hypothetical protein
MCVWVTAEALVPSRPLTGHTSVMARLAVPVHVEVEPSQTLTACRSRTNRRRVLLARQAVVRQRAAAGVAGVVTPGLLTLPRVRVSFVPLVTLTLRRRRANEVRKLVAGEAVANRSALARQTSWVTLRTVCDVWIGVVPG